VFEWYDFYLYGLLATIISAQFFSGVNETTGFIFALAAFAAGFRGAAVRRAGVRAAGRHGRAQIHLPGHHGADGLCDLHGRPAAPMPASGSRRRSCWWCCGCCRAWRSAANMAARRPTSPSTRPTTSAGFYTSFIQTTATLGLFAALLVVIGTRT
jgi:hypothetical protein